MYARIASFRMSDASVEPHMVFRDSRAGQIHIFKKKKNQNRLETIWRHDNVTQLAYKINQKHGCHRDVLFS